MSQIQDPNLIQGDVDPNVPQTSGMRWVGASFNPSKNHNVDEIKTHFAQACDTLERWVGQRDSPLTNDERMLYEAAKTDLLRAQMLAVKLFTYNL